MAWSYENLVTDTLSAAGNGNGRQSPVRFSVDALESKGRRKAPQLLLRSEDDDIGPIVRRGQLQTIARDIRRNYALAAWAIRKHLDYVSSFSFQSKIGDKTLDKRVDELMTWVSRPGNFEVAGRHSRSRYFRLAEAARTVDGDMLNVLVANGRLQAIEGDRIRTPISYGRGNQQMIPPETLQRMRYGVVLNAWGGAEAYAVNKRGPVYSYGPDRIGPANAFTFERLVPARNAIHLGYFERFDQVRGNSPLVAALNHFRDTYEGLDYALAKAKVSQLFAIAILRKAVDGLPGATSDGSKIDIDFNRGPIALDLDYDEDVKVVESGQPSDQWQNFMAMVIAIALLSLDIPFVFFDASKCNYSQHRGALLQYDQSAQSKREDLLEFANRWTAWRLAVLINQGLLDLPAGFDPQKELRWDWVPTGVPWLDPMKEVQADGLAVDRGFDSTPGICRAGGKDAYAIAEDQAAYLKHREALGLPPPAALAPMQIQMETEK